MNNHHPADAEHAGSAGRPGEAQSARSAGYAQGAEHVGSAVGGDDVRRRPVVLRAGRVEDAVPRRAGRIVAWAGTGLLGLVAAAGLVAGGTAVWSAFDPGSPGESPAPLWFAPPETIAPQSERVTPTADDHGGDRTRTPTTGSTTEPGDDKGGDRPTSAKSATGTSTSGKSSGTSTSAKSSGTATSGQHGSDGSGKSGADDGSGHR